jgi:hypothetical protein
MMQTTSNEEEEAVADPVPPVDTSGGDRVEEAEPVISEAMPPAAEDEPRPKKKKRLKVPAVCLYIYLEFNRCCFV